MKPVLPTGRGGCRFSSLKDLGPMETVQEGEKEGIMTDRQIIEAAIRRSLGLPADHVLTDKERQRQVLDLSETHVSDISVVAELTSLEEFYLGGTDVADAQVEQIRKALPACRIYG